MLGGDPATLLAGGEALLSDVGATGAAACRWYRAASSAVVLGRGQPQSVVKEASLPVLLRGSGGGAVLLGPDLLCLDVALPAGHPWLRGELGTVFLHIGQAWSRALVEFGVGDVAVHEGAAQARRTGDARQRFLAEVCYATLGRGEVTARGRKVVGLAQRRRRHGALVQCGLLRHWAPGPLLEALGADPDDPDLTDRATGLDDLLEAPPDDETVRLVVERALSAAGIDERGTT